MTESAGQPPLPLHPIARFVVRHFERNTIDGDKVRSALQVVHPQELAYAAMSLLALADHVAELRPMLIRVCAAQSGPMQAVCNQQCEHREDAARARGTALDRFSGRKTGAPNEASLGQRSARSLASLRVERRVLDPRRLAISRAR